MTDLSAKARRAAVFSVMAIVLWVGGGRPLAAEVKTSLSFQYYPVQYIEGYTPKQMIFNSSPFTETDGRRDLGQTRWVIGTANISFLQSPEGLCRLQSFEVNLSATIIVPQLEGNTSSRAEREFAAFTEKIRLHEMEHYEIALDYAGRLEGEYAALNHRHCHDFGEHLQNIYDRTVRECKIEQIRFDDREGFIEDE